jgi:hypothetical protein
MLFPVVSRVRGRDRGRGTHIGLGGIGATVQERRPVPLVGLPHARSASILIQQQFVSCRSGPSKFRRAAWPVVRVGVEVAVVG